MTRINGLDCTSFCTEDYEDDVISELITLEEIADLHLQDYRLRVININSLELVAFEPNSQRKISRTHIADMTIEGIKELRSYCYGYADGNFFANRPKGHN